MGERVERDEQRGEHHAGDGDEDRGEPHPVQRLGRRHAGAVSADGGDCAGEEEAGCHAELFEQRVGGAVDAFASPAGAEFVLVANIGDHGLAHEPHALQAEAEDEIRREDPVGVLRFHREKLRETADRRDGEADDECVAFPDARGHRRIERDADARAGKKQIAREALERAGLGLVAAEEVVDDERRADGADGECGDEHEGAREKHVEERPVAQGLDERIPDGDFLLHGGLHFLPAEKCGRGAGDEDDDRDAEADPAHAVQHDLRGVGGGVRIRSAEDQRELVKPRDAESTDQPEDHAPALDAGPFVVVAGQLEAERAIRHDEERIGEIVEERGDADEPRQRAVAPVWAGQPEDEGEDGQRDGAREDEGPAAAPAGARIVGEIADGRVGEGVEIARQRECLGDQLGGHAEGDIEDGADELRERLRGVVVAERAERPREFRLERDAVGVGGRGEFGHREWFGFLTQRRGDAESAENFCKSTRSATRGVRHLRGLRGSASLLLKGAR